MLFVSSIFLFVFLPIVIIGNYILKGKWKNYFLLAASLIFYAWGEPIFVLIMIFSIILNYFTALKIDQYRDIKAKKVFYFMVAIFFDFGVLIIFKYLNFITLNINQVFADLVPITKIALPIGISFFTFQGVSYVIDVYRNDVKVQKNILYVALYVSFFPQLIAGPIVRYVTIAEEIEQRKVSFDDFSEGVYRFVIGFNKKVILANNLAIVADKAFSISPENLSMPLAWLGALAYTFQIYFDFGGYSDMAIGLGRMFGFKFLENFNYPYIAKSLSDFWRRWHISLSSWFRDYVYIPLGGSKVCKKRLLFNLFVVWTFSGIWHGANWTFLAWGILYFLILSFEKFTGLPEKFNSKFASGMYRLFTMCFIIFAWVIFRSDSIGSAFQYMQTMLGFTNVGVYDPIANLYFYDYCFFFLVAVICSTPIIKNIKKAIKSKRIASLYEYASAIGVIFIFIIAISYVVLGSYNPFIYFNF